MSLVGYDHSWSGWFQRNKPLIQRVVGIGKKYGPKALKAAGKFYERNIRQSGTLRGTNPARRQLTNPMRSANVSLSGSSTVADSHGAYSGYSMHHGNATNSVHRGGRRLKRVKQRPVTKGALKRILDIVEPRVNLRYLYGAKGANTSLPTGMIGANDNVLFGAASSNSYTWYKNWCGINKTMLEAMITQANKTENFQLFWSKGPQAVGFTDSNGNSGQSAILKQNVAFGPIFTKHRFFNANNYPIKLRVMYYDYRQPNTQYSDILQEWWTDLRALQQLGADAQNVNSYNAGVAAVAALATSITATTNQITYFEPGGYLVMPGGAGGAQVDYLITGCNYQLTSGTLTISPAVVTAIAAGSYKYVPPGNQPTAVNSTQKTSGTNNILLNNAVNYTDGYQSLYKGLFNGHIYKPVGTRVGHFYNIKSSRMIVLAPGDSCELEHKVPGFVYREDLANLSAFADSSTNANDGKNIAQFQKQWSGGILFGAVALNEAFDNNGTNLQTNDVLPSAVLHHTYETTCTVRSPVWTVQKGASTFGSRYNTSAVVGAGVMDELTNEVKTVLTN